MVELGISDTPVEDVYNLGDELGRGQYGVVMLCSSKETGEEFAAKFIRKRRGRVGRGQKVEDIHREISIMQDLGPHPGLVALESCFQDKTNIIMVLELLRGQELFSVLAQQDHFTEAEAVQYLKQILNGLAYIHHKGYIHLDLKPENIVLQDTGRRKLKIIDFGLAKKYNPRATPTEIVGTPEFMAPETISFETPSPATDMWAVGVITYILLSGCSPFLGDTDNETFSNITSGEVYFPEEYFESLSPEVENFILVLLAPAPRARLSAEKGLVHKWLAPRKLSTFKRIGTKRLRQFNAQRTIVVEDDVTENTSEEKKEPATAEVAATESTNSDKQPASVVVPPADAQAADDSTQSPVGGVEEAPAKEESLVAAPSSATSQDSATVTEDPSTIVTEDPSTIVTEDPTPVQGHVNAPSTTAEQPTDDSAQARGSGEVPLAGVEIEDTSATSPAEAAGDNAKLENGETAAVAHVTVGDSEPMNSSSAGITPAITAVSVQTEPAEPPAASLKTNTTVNAATSADAIPALDAAAPSKSLCSLTPVAPTEQDDNFKKFKRVKSVMVRLSKEDVQQQQVNMAGRNAKPKRMSTSRRSRRLPVQKEGEEAASTVATQLPEGSNQLKSRDSTGEETVEGTSENVNVSSESRTPPGLAQLKSTHFDQTANEDLDDAFLGTTVTDKEVVDNLLNPNQITDEYQMGKELGRGKFGVVKLCTHLRTGELFAAKFIRKRNDNVYRGQKVEDIHREVAIMNDLSAHSRLVCLETLFEDSTHVIMVMEYLRGQELFQQLAAKEHITELEAAGYVRQIVQGLEFMHFKGYIHLDMKPENVVLTDMQRRNLKIIDFGHAKRYDPKAEPTEIVGSPEFMAPETISFDPPSPATDMWAVGVITYILLTGCSPFLGNDDSETFARISSGEFKMPKDLCKELSPDLESFIVSMLAQNPSDRFTAAKAMVHKWLVPKATSENRLKRIATIKLQRFNEEHVDRPNKRKFWKLAGKRSQSKTALPIEESDSESVGGDGEDSPAGRRGSKRRTGGTNPSRSLINMLFAKSNASGGNSPVQGRKSPRADRSAATPVQSPRVMVVQSETALMMSPKKDRPSDEARYEEEWPPVCATSKSMGNVLASTDIHNSFDEPSPPETTTSSPTNTGYESPLGETGDVIKNGCTRNASFPLAAPVEDRVAKSHSDSRINRVAGTQAPDVEAEQASQTRNKFKVLRGLRRRGRQ